MSKNVSPNVPKNGYSDADTDTGAAEVVIAGAGPNGLMFAAELRLAGVRPIVLDPLPAPNPDPRANGMVGQVIRLLDMRGLYEQFSGVDGPPVAIPGFFFGGMPVSFTEVADNPLHAMLIPQPRLVRLLAERARALGVEMRWGHELVGLNQRDDEVSVRIAGPDGEYQLRTRFLVGADGGRSRTRKLAGIEFPGITHRSVTRIAHIRPPAALRTGGGGLSVPGLGRVKPAFNRLDNGSLTYAEQEPGRALIATTEPGTADVPEETPMTLDELTASLRRVTGVDVPVESPAGPGPHALRRIDGQNTRIAERYRDGRVFLVGDAAHVHSAMGGPGLNLGLQDAANLGWKLAAYLNGHGDDALLDSYQRERRPVGERVMTHSLAQTALMEPGPLVTALRELIGELLDAPENAGRIARLLAGSEIRYDVGDTHPLSGWMVPEFTVKTADGNHWIAEFLRDARPVLLDFTAGTEFLPAAQEWIDRVDLVAATSSDAPAAALLVRPDGYVAWATDSTSEDGQSRLRTALERWWGSASVRRESVSTTH